MLPRTRTESKQVERRLAPRVSINLSVELYVRGYGYPAVIQNLSRFGARVGCQHDATVGSVVELVISRAGAPGLRLVGRIVYRIGDPDASADETFYGVGIRFDDAAAPDDAAFAAAIDRLHAPPAERSPPGRRRAADKPTQPMPGVVLSDLLVASCPVLDATAQRFTGSISELGVLGLLTILERSRKSGQLVLVFGALDATIELVEGRIVGASSSIHGVTAEEILMFVVDWNDGTFELLSLEASPIAAASALPPRSVTEMLLDHANERDEAARRRARARRRGQPL